MQASSLAQALFECSPPLVKRIMANVEALRRDQFRRYGDFSALVALHNPDYQDQELRTQQSWQFDRLRRLLQLARQAPHYRARLPADLEASCEQDLRQLPILSKDDLRRDPQALVRDRISPNTLWLNTTSGSTGSPLRFYVGRSAVRSRHAVTDAFMAWHGCHFGERRARFSGVLVARSETSQPPFWLYVDRYSQLQCSSYHLSPGTAAQFVDALQRARVTYGTGYASSWHLLATCAQEADLPPLGLKAIFTDSEGLSLKEQQVMEQAFHCPVFQTYGLGETGTVAVQCRVRRYHVLTRACILEVLDDSGDPVPPGSEGEIVVTDLSSEEAPILRYRTGDLAVAASAPCACGWKSPSLHEIVGRLDDRIRTPEGRWIGRLGLIAQEMQGVRESQIAQVATDHVVIRVVPGPGWDPDNMRSIIHLASKYIGPSTKISWEAVDRVPRHNSGKIKYLVREIEI